MEPLEVELGAKSGISRESNEKIVPIDRDPDQSVANAYQKLADYKKTRGLNVLYAKPTPAEKSQQTSSNTESYEKVQRMIYSQAQMISTEKATEKSLQLDRDEKLKQSQNTYWLELVVEGDTFHISFIFIILLQNILIVCKTIPGLLATRQTLWIDIVFLLVFSSEILFKWRYGFVKFWQSSWNCLCFTVWWLELIALCLGSEKGNIASTLRIIRFIMPFKSRRRAHYLIGVRSVVSTITGSAGDVGRIAIFVVGMSYFWACSGVILFSEVIPLDFGTLPSAFFTLFVALTQIGWIDTFVELSAKGYFTAAWLYYVSYFFIVVFIIFKIIVAVVVSNLEDFHKKLSHEKKKRKRKLRSTTAAVNGVSEREIIPMPETSAVWMNQIALEVPDFSMVSKDKLDNYFAVLAIIERNLGEYSQLLDSLRNIQAEVQSINSAMLDSKKGEEKEIASDEEAEEEEYVEPVGDALSRLMRRRSVRPLR